MADFTLHEGFPALRLQEGMVLRLNAIDPVSGDEVTGVVVTKWSIYGDSSVDGIVSDIVPVYSPDSDGEGG
ncbi:MAG TPA: hypothetical protein VNC18_17530 [Gemmatimonadaceae bacterium]|nr:hypothetical protein [Gemmatimonadaceae bacterium]